MHRVIRSTLIVRLRLKIAFQMKIPGKRLCRTTLQMCKVI